MPICKLCGEWVDNSNLLTHRWEKHREIMMEQSQRAQQRSSEVRAENKNALRDLAKEVKDATTRGKTLRSFMNSANIEPQNKQPKKIRVIFEVDQTIIEFKISGVL